VVTDYARNLPHWQPEGKALFITWRLWGTLPASSWNRIKARLNARMTAEGQPGKQKARGQECPRHLAPSAGEYFAAMDRLLDRCGTGVAWLSDEGVARAVVDSLRRGDELQHYRLHAFVLMPNHVHILIQPHREAIHSLKVLKGSSARAANKILHRTGQPFWQDESFDHWVRSGAEFERIRRYIEQNPVKAGFVAQAENWPWSSAGKIPAQP